jgi:hypothetical protein
MVRIFVAMMNPRDLLVADSDNLYYRLGDADNRVRAIAKEVFGLTTIFWNQE